MKVYVKYDKDGFVVGMGDTVEQLSKEIRVGKSTIYKALERGSKTYAVIEIEDEENEE